MHKTPYRHFLLPLLLLAVLAACTDGDGPLMRQQLERLEKMNQADSVMTNDTLAERLVKYFDRHGNPNERMRAHYILGRTYADMGEAPAALEAYLEAADCADTTANDCDYRTLGCIYSQMADSYHRQLLLSNEIWARRKSYYYASVASDTLGCISEIKFMASAYILLNKQDSAEILLKKALQLYEECGYIQEGLYSSAMLMSLYIQDQCHLNDLKILINKFETKCDLFDKNHELPPFFRQYYYYKGQYMEIIGELDSAEFYYRKVNRPNMSFVSSNPMYEGLLSVFAKRHQADSIAKYAQLYCTTNDSSIAIKDKELTAQLAASYQYRRFQKQAYENEKKADRERLRMYILIILFSLLATAGAFAFHWFKKRKLSEIESLKSDYAEATEKYHDNLRSIDVLRNAHKQVINIIQQELHDAKGESSKYAEKYQKAQTTISDINNQYEAEILELKTENEKLQDTINQLKQCKDLSPFVDNSTSFFASDIVDHIKSNAKKSVFSVTEDEWNELTSAVCSHYPSLVSDLNALKSITQQKLRVCFLVILSLRSSDISNIMDVPSQRISNLKSEINDCLFGESSARSLYPNLAKKYNIIV